MCCVGSARSSGRTEGPLLRGEQEEEDREWGWRRGQALDVRLGSWDFVRRAGRARQGLEQEGCLGEPLWLE